MTGAPYAVLRGIAYAVLIFFATSAVPNMPALALARWNGAQVVSGAAPAGTQLGWLGAVGVWALSRGGTVTVLVVAATATVAAFALVEARARRYVSDLWALVAVAAAVAASLDALGAGGVMVSAFFAAALALALDCNARWKPPLAGAIAVLWCNVTPDGILAPAIAIAVALGAGRGNGARSAWYAAAACVMATLATPAFLAFPVRAVVALSLDRALADVVAIHPADVAPRAYLVGFTFVVAAFIAFGSRPRLRGGGAALVVFATLLALANGAYLPLFGVLAAPFLVCAAAGERRMSPGAPSRNPALNAALVLGAVALALWLGVSAAPRTLAAVASQPYALTDRLVASPPHRWFCADVAWCSYILATGPPGTSVLADGRIGVADASTRVAQRTIVHTAPGWRAVVERERIDALLVRRDRALATFAAMSPAWRLLASDDTAALYLRAHVAR